MANKTTPSIQDLKGNIGIGTASPVTGLDVRTSAYSNTTARFGTTKPVYIINDEPIIGLNMYYDGGWKAGSSGYSGYLGMRPSNGDMYFRLSTQSNAADAAVTDTTPLYIKNNGNVGIGSTAPAAKLNVASTGANAYSSTITKGTNMKGIINALSNNADDMVGVYFGTGTTSEGTHWSGITGSRSQSATDWSTQLNFYTHNEDVANINDATQKMVIKGNGNVGIGTTSPDTLLHIESTSDASSSILTIENDNDIKLKLGSVRSAAGTAPDTTFIAYDADLRFISDADSTTEVVRIDSSGNVGIGTTSPGSYDTAKVGNAHRFLNVQAPTGNYAVNTLAGGLGGNGDRIGFLTFVNDTNSATYKYSAWIGSEVEGTTANKAGGRLVFSTTSDNSTAGPIERMRITAGGNVGIGTDSPASNLHIKTSVDNSVSQGLIIERSANSDKGYINYNGGGFQFRSTVGDPIVFGETDAEHMRIKPDGNVGIGTTNPNNILELYKTVSSDIGPVLQLTNSQYADANNSGSSIQFRGYTTWGPGSTNPRYSEINAINGGGSVPKRIEFKFYADTDVKTPLAILQTGNVGIGTTSPNTFLHVAGQGNKAGGSIYLGNQDDGSTKYGLITSAHYNAATEPKGFSLISGLSTATENTVSIGGFVWESNPATDIRFFTHTATTHTTGGSERMRINSSGNVGIGETNPTSGLVVRKDTAGGRGGEISIVNYATNTIGNEAALNFGLEASTYNADLGNAQIKARVMAANAASDMIFSTWNGSSFGERMRIDSAGAIKFNAYGAGFLQTDANGNITAGTVTTSDTLDDVTDNGNSTTNSITVGSVTSTGGGEMQGGDLYFKNGGDDGAGTHLSNVWYSVSTGGGTAPVGVYESAVIKTVANGTHGRSDLVFKTKDNDTANFGSAVERMRILKDGRIGINTSNPLFGRFQVTQSANNDESGIGILSASSARSMRLWTDESVSYVSSGNNGAGILSLNQGGGNVGIGENNPVSLLHLGKNAGGVNIISFGDASLGGPHGLDFYGDDATRTLKYSIYYRTGTENISMETSNGTKRFEINQNGGVTFNEAFTFPTADGSAGAALVTNGSGALSWNSGYKQYSPVGWTILNNQTYTSTGANISSSSTQAQAGTTPVQRNSATEFEATKQGWYEITYSFLVKNNYTNRAMIGAYMTVSTSSGGGVVPGSHSTQYVRYNTYGEYAQIQNTFYYYTAASSTNFYLLAYLLSGSMNMTTQSINQSMISFRYINNDIT